MFVGSVVEKRLDLSLGMERWRDNKYLGTRDDLRGTSDRDWNLSDVESRCRRCRGPPRPVGTLKQWVSVPSLTCTLVVDFVSFPRTKQQTVAVSQKWDIFSFSVSKTIAVNLRNSLFLSLSLLFSL